MNRVVALGAAIVLLAACTSAGGRTMSPTSTTPTSTVSQTRPIGSAPASPGRAGPMEATALVMRVGEPWISYQAGGDGTQYGIWLARTDGTGAHPLAPSDPAHSQLHPDFSPDGLRLVFAEVGEAHIELWAVDADGRDPHRAVACETTCALVDEPAWSPDGTTIVFHRQKHDGANLVSTLELLDVASGGSTVVLTARSDRLFFAPRWSPDGKRIVAESVHRTSPTNADDISGGELVVIDLSATEPTPRTITGSSYWPANPDWSPDGKTIVFFRPLDPANFEGPSDLWTIRPDGSGLRQLTHQAGAGGTAIHPAWTPDGSRVLFVASGPNVSGDTTIVSIAADGTDLRSAISAGYLNGLHPRLRPTP